MAKTSKKEAEQIKMDIKFNNWWDAAEQQRSDIDWKWFIYDMWVSGNHYAKWDKDTQQITASTPNDGRIRVVINKVYTTLRSVRNFVLRNRPRGEVTPDNLTEETINDAIALNKYLDFLHDKLKLRTKLKASIWHALKYSVGFWQVLWDEDEKEIKVNEIDPFDLYWDPVARTPQEARYVFLAVRRNIEDIVNDPKYRDYIKENQIEIKADGKLSASSYKERAINFEKTGKAGSANDKNNTAIVQELWFKEYDEKGKQKIKITARIDGQTIRPVEDTNTDIIPFFKLASDIEPLKMYGQGWVKNLIPPNKLLNKLESQVAEYNDLMNRGRFVSDKGAGVRIITNQNGQIIEKKRGFEVAQQPIAPLSAAIFKQIDNANMYIEDMGGAHDASMGRIPTGAKSGKALEALQVGDSNNLSEIVENAEEFLEEVYEYILKLASKKYQFARRIVPTTASGEREFIKVIGESAPTVSEGLPPEGAVVIRENNMVDVKITSWLAETAEARRDALQKLYELKAIDNATLLEGYSIGNVAGIVKKVMLEKAKEKAMETMQQVELAKAQNANKAPAAPEPAQAGAMQANAALQAVINGQEPEIPDPVTPDYLSYIDQFMSAPEFGSLPDEDKQAVQAFRVKIAQLVR